LEHGIGRTKVPAFLEKRENNQAGNKSQDRNEGLEGAWRRTYKGEIGSEAGAWRRKQCLNSQEPKSS
jgi:hypothetical protein